MYWIGVDWIGTDWIGLEWIDLEWIGFDGKGMGVCGWAGGPLPHSSTQLGYKHTISIQAFC